MRLRIRNDSAECHVGLTGLICSGPPETRGRAEEAESAKFEARERKEEEKFHVAEHSEGPSGRKTIYSEVCPPESSLSLNLVNLTTCSGA